MIRRTVVALALLATACATGERITKLREGMSPSEVTGILGDPTGVRRDGEVGRQRELGVGAGRYLLARYSASFWAFFWG